MATFHSDLTVGRSGCSPPFTKELHDLTDEVTDSSYKRNIMCIMLIKNVYDADQKCIFVKKL